jgi:peptidoglycan hydrolase-like protein with peptidoglycan-binding domain
MLQSFLVSKGFLVIPTGISMGQFGSLTRRAVAQYQASVGITPANGFFGPITRAHVNAKCVPTTSNPSSNPNSNPNPPVSNNPGCPTGAYYNYLTGAVCNAPTNTAKSLGDANGDGKVDFSDLTMYAQSVGGPYNAAVDFNNDRSVDTFDLAILSNNYNKTVGKTTNITAGDINNAFARASSISTFPGDATGDGKTNFDDMVKLAQSMNSSSGQSNFNSAADFNKDNVVDVFDLAILSNNYNKSKTVQANAQARISIQRPNGGETVAQGESLSIIWNSAVPTQPVDVKVINQNGTVVLIQNSVTPSNSGAQSLGFATSPSRLPLGYYKAQVCSSGTTNCAESNGYFTAIAPVANVSPVISQPTPQPVQIGSTLTFNLANGGRSGNIILKTADGSKSWSTGYATDVSYLGGYSHYNGSTLSITIPSTIGRGVHPDGWWNEPVVPVTSGTYKLYVGSIDSANNFIQSNILDIAVGSTIYSGLKGDADGNGKVERADYAKIISIFGSKLGDSNFIVGADLDNNNSIGNGDLGYFLANFGSVLVKGDVNGDGVVNKSDLDIYASGDMKADLNYDGKVDFSDIVIIAQNYNSGVELTSKMPGYAGDATGDSKVDFSDMVKVAQAYNSSYGQSSYNLLADFNLDGKVDHIDQGIMAKNYNTTGPAFAAPRAGDVNGDGAIDTFDMARYTNAKESHVGQAAYDFAVDFNKDGKVDFSDMVVIAQNYGSAVQGASASCVVITNNLSKGSTDANSNGEVTVLQSFLETQGFSFSSKGTFGALTENAVASWQTTHGISATGTVGPLTKEAIRSASCR